MQACVDVVASSGWLKPALAAMEMSQMVVQGLWDEDSSLLQLPHFTKDLALRCKDAENTSVFELRDMKVSDRNIFVLVLQPNFLASCSQTLSTAQSLGTIMAALLDVPTERRREIGWSQGSLILNGFAVGL